MKGGIPARGRPRTGIPFRSAFGATAEPVEQRLGQLVRRLRREGLLAYRDLDRMYGPPGHPLNRG